MDHGQEWTNITILIPKRSTFPLDCNNEENDAEASVIFLPFQSSRALWRVAYPLLITEPQKRIVRCAINCLIEREQVRRYGPHRTEPTSGSVTRSNCRLVLTQFDDGHYHHRRLRALLTADLPYKYMHKGDKKRAKNVLLYIQPPNETSLEYTFSGILIKWEHALIRAQSVTGYLATLGGGFFLCHHFQTAVSLALKQQQLAILLNDWAMFYKCSINQAYNYIYAGKFKIANRLIRLVRTQVQQQQQGALAILLKDDEIVLLNMCASALLFSKRMAAVATCTHKRQSILHSTSTINNSKTEDDLARVRVMRDQSRTDDLVKPLRLVTTN